MRKSKSFRIVIDTNLWIHFIISNTYNKLDPFLLKNELLILFCAELMDEIKRCITKPKLKKYFSEKQSFDEMLNVFDPFIHFIDINHSVNLCRDPKDNFLLSLAIEGNADYLITGDKDLLVIGKFQKTKMVSFSQFLQLMNK